MRLLKGWLPFLMPFGGKHVIDKPAYQASFCLSRGTIATIRQLCRIRRHTRGEIMDETLGAWATRELAEELERDPSLAVIARGKGSKSSPRRTAPPPQPRPMRSRNEW